MQITIQNLKEMYGTLLRDAQLYQLNRARMVVLQQYCNKLTLRNACSGDCKTCGVEIQKALEFMKEKQVPRMSYGIFGQLMKTAYARKLEEMLKKPQARPETNTLGEATERDALDIFEEMLNGG